MTPAYYRSRREQLGLTQIALAVRLGVPVADIERREAGEVAITTEMQIAINALCAVALGYDGVDWSRPNSEIARTLGVTASAVSHARTRLAPQKRLPQGKRYDWSEIDWQKSDAAIARETGATPGAVCRARARRAANNKGQP